MERSTPHAFLSSLSRSIALAITLGAPGACARSARGPPVPVHIALERARQALCTVREVESPLALVAAFAPEEPCRASDAVARVRCYLAQPDTTVRAQRIPDGVRIRVAIPQLSDHVHEVVVRRRGSSLTVDIDSRN